MRAGGNGEEATFTEAPFLQVQPFSECRKEIGPRGVEILQLARAAELRIVNGLQLPVGVFEADGSATRDLRDLGVGEYLVYYDHRPVELSWARPENCTAEDSAAASPPVAAPMGWRDYCVPLR